VGSFNGIVDGQYKYSTVIHCIQGDTVIAGQRCKKWLQQDANAPDPDYWYVVYAYEENRKVWFFYAGESIQHLFFDFGARLGETFKVWMPYARAYEIAKQQLNNSELEVVFSDSLSIEKVECIMNNGYPQNRYYYSTASNNYIESEYNYLIEGVGALQSPYFNLDYSYSLPNRPLVSCIVNHDILFFDEHNATITDTPIPTSISSNTLVNGKCSNDKCFDLAGRRLAAPPAKGVYIKDGKKVAR
jgi:hypothetical protein